MSQPFSARVPFRARGPWRARGPFAAKTPWGMNEAGGWAIDATGAQIRAAMSDITAYASGGWRIPGTAGARVNASARTSAAMQQRADGVWEFAAHNLLTYSEQFDNAAWLGANRTVTANATASPDGALTADVMVPNNGASTSTVVQDIDCTVSTPYTVSVYVKSAGMASANIRFVTRQTKGGTFVGDVRLTLTFADGTYTLSDGDGTPPTIKSAVVQPLSNGWYRVAISAVTNSNALGLRLDVRNVSVGDGTNGIYVWGAQFNLGPTPTTYVPTTTAAVYAPAIDWLSAQSAYGVRSEVAATNRALWSRDLTNAAWTATNATTAKTATGVDNVANSASVVTATNANATVLQAITHASTARTLSLFLKRRTGTGGIDITLDGGSTWTAVTITSSWARYSATQTLADPSVGVRLQTSGDAVDVDVVQCEDGSLATSLIITQGATATRAADAVVVPDTSPGWIGQTAGTVAVEYVPQEANSATIVAFNDTTANEQIVLSNDGVLTVTDGGAAQATPDSGAPTAAARNRMAAAYAANDFSVSLNGGAVATDTSGTLPTTTQLALGVSLNGTITRVRAVNRRLADGQLRALST